jgi:RNA-binding protein
MLTTKQRAYLKSLANGLNAVFQIGKSGVTPEIVDAVDEYLEANELLKLSVLQNCAESAKTVADQIGGRSRSEVVQVIGKKIVLYRESRTKKNITLPK